MKFGWGILILVATIQSIESNDVERRIIVSNQVPQPLAFYSQGVQVNNVLYISGNLGMTREGHLAEGVTNQTKLALDNVGHILEAAGVTFDNVVKVTVMLSDIQDYGAMNEVYGQYFKDKAPARTAFMATLPREAKVEIDAVAIVGHIVDVDGVRSNASSIGGMHLVVMLVLAQGLITYRSRNKLSK